MDDFTALIERCRRRDEEAFETVVSRFQKSVHALAWHMLHSRTEAEDVTQEAFLQVFLELNALTDARAFKNWLFRIATRLCLRRLKRRPPAWWPLREGHEDKDLDAVLVRDSLARALDGLTPELRAAVLLRDLHDQPYEEIAATLAIPVGTVKSRINTARARLRVELDRGKEVVACSI